MPDEATLELEALPDSAAIARVFVRENTTLDTMRHSEADLLVTELIGNALAHSPAADKLTLRVSQDREHGATISISHPHHGAVDFETSGVGLTLVDRLSRSWGHDYDEDRLTVWFVLRTPGTTALSEDIGDNELFARMDEDPAAYSDELVRRHADLAASIARRYRGKGVDEDDLLQVANMALLKAIQRYDPTLGEIRPYAAATISGELKRLLRDRGWSVRVPRSLQERSLEVARAAEDLAQTLNRPPDTSELAERMGVSEDEVREALEARQAYSSRSIENPDESSGVSIGDLLEDDDAELLLADDRLLVSDAIRTLPERQQTILRLRFVEDMTQSEIAEEVGISQMHVSRLLSRSLAALKKSIGEDAGLG